jgi:hypothetical protein
MTPGVPNGGTNGLSHEQTAAVDETARFLLVTPPGERPKPLVQALREIFGPGSLGAVNAIRQSHGIRGA